MSMVIRGLLAAVASAGLIALGVACSRMGSAGSSAAPASAPAIAVATTEPPSAPKPEPVAAKPVSPVAAQPAGKTDLTMFGGTPDRNMVVLAEKNLPGKPPKIGDNGIPHDEPGTDGKMLWKAEMGSKSYGGPTIAHGKVIVGTNNERPRNKRDTLKTPDGEIEPIDRGVVMCFDEKTGAFLWQAVHKKLESGNVNDWPKEGVCSTPLVEGNKVYYVSNRCTVVCVDLNGFADGNQGVQTETFKDATDADVLWEYDMMGVLNVFPHNMAACSPLIVGDTIFVVSANGVDEGHINIPSPEAPSFLALDKNTGKLKWQSSVPGKNIMHGQWSNATYAEFGGVKTVIFPGGDGYLYGMSPDTGDILWKFDANPKSAFYELGGAGTKNDFISTPVVYDGKVYIGVGQDPEHFTGIGQFYCFDPAGKKGDISPELFDREEKLPDGKVRAVGKANPNSAVVWRYGGEDKRKLVPRDFVFGRTMSTACIVDGVVYIGELQGYVHVLDAKTGKKFWQYDIKGAIWGSPFYADGKVYVATESCDLFVFKHTKTPQVLDELDNPTAADAKDFRKQMLAKRKDVEAASLVAKVEFDAPIRSTPVAANGVLYVMTEKTLYAFGKK